jgi:hypothetical protein
MNTNVGNAGPDYGMDQPANRALAALEKMLRQHDAGVLAGIVRLDGKDAREMMEICDEGVASIEAASQGVAPVQKVIVGIAYTVNALREWREKGPLAGALES